MSKKPLRLAVILQLRIRINVKGGATPDQNIIPSVPLKWDTGTLLLPSIMRVYLRHSDEVRVAATRASTGGEPTIADLLLASVYMSGKA